MMLTTISPGLTLKVALVKKNQSIISLDTLLKIQALPIRFKLVSMIVQLPGCLSFKYP